MNKQENLSRNIQTTPPKKNQIEILEMKHTISKKKIYWMRTTDYRQSNKENGKFEDRE